MGSPSSGVLRRPDHQAAIPTGVFKVMEQEFQVSHECFASPFNHTLPSFGSAFYDTDRFFGSRGSFFSAVNPSVEGAAASGAAQPGSHIHQLMQGGSFQANPPFVEESMQLMSETIDAVLCYTHDQVRHLCRCESLFT